MVIKPLQDPYNLFTTRWVVDNSNRLHLAPPSWPTSRTDASRRVFEFFNGHCRTQTSKRNHELPTQALGATESESSLCKVRLVLMALLRDRQSHINGRATLLAGGQTNSRVSIDCLLATSWAEFCTSTAESQRRSSLRKACISVIRRWHIQTWVVDGPRELCARDEVRKRRPRQGPGPSTPVLASTLAPIVSGIVAGCFRAQLRFIDILHAPACRARSPGPSSVYASAAPAASPSDVHKDHAGSRLNLMDSSFVPARLATRLLKRG